MEEQIRRFEVGAFFGEVFDGVAAVAQDAGVAIDKSNFADAGRGVIEGGVITHHAEFVGVHFDLAEVHGADGAVGYGDFVGLAGAIVRDGEGFARGSGSLRLFRLRCGRRGIHKAILGSRDSK